MSLTVFSVVILAAFLHAVWNAMVKMKKTNTLCFRNRIWSCADINSCYIFYSDTVFSKHSLYSNFCNISLKVWVVPTISIQIGRLYKSLSNCSRYRSNFYCCIIFALLIGTFFLKERFTFLKTMSVLTIFFGVILLKFFWRI